MMLLPPAVRNVLRDRRCPVTTILSIIVGLTAMVFDWRFTAGTNREMVENITRYFAGDTQVHLGGYHDDLILDLTMPDSIPILHAMCNGAGVATVSIRLETKTLASRSDKSCGLVPVGVESVDGTQVTMLSDAIIAGQPLMTGASGVLIGEMLVEAFAV